jgi:hypothetical protein
MAALGVVIAVVVLAVFSKSSNTGAVEEGVGRLPSK